MLLTQTAIRTLEYGSSIKTAVARFDLRKPADNKARILNGITKSVFFSIIRRPRKPKGNKLNTQNHSNIHGKQGRVYSS